MNIIYVDHYAGGPSYGMEYRPYYLAREWVRSGHHVVIIAASYSHLRSHQPLISGRFTREFVDGIEFIWCMTPHYKHNGLLRVLNIISFLRLLAQWRYWLTCSPDVVIASSTYPADIYTCRKIARHFNSLLVWEVHDLWPLSPMELGKMSPWHPFIVWMQHAENFACKYSNLVVSLLPKANLHLQDHGMDNSKFHYIPNGIDSGEWEDSQTTELSKVHNEAIKQARSSSRIIIGYAGGHGVSNALDCLIDAAKCSSNLSVSWILVGNGPEKSRLKQRAIDESIKNIYFLDPIPKKEIPAFLQKMDILYIGFRSQPLYQFGISPNKIMDYMMSGRPIICAIDAKNSIVDDAGCGLVIPSEDPVALLNAVEHFMHLSQEERLRIGAKGTQYISREHNYSLLAKKFMDAIVERIK
jgi:glycosyltransferase involved in cell wall biosynthesis